MTGTENYEMKQPIRATDFFKGYFLRAWKPVLKFSVLQDPFEIILSRIDLYVWNNLVYGFENSQVPGLGGGVGEGDFDLTPYQVRFFEQVIWYKGSLPWWLHFFLRFTFIYYEDFPSKGSI